MDRLEYQITFMTFFIGLGVADLFTTLVRLLKNREKVKWHGLSIIWSANAFLGLIVAWGVYPELFAHPSVNYGPGFIVAITPAIFIFAFTVSILPHHQTGETLDMRQHYFDNHRLVFSLFSLDIFSRILTNILLLERNLLTEPVAGLIFGIYFLFVVGLIFTKSKIYHTILAVFTLLIYLMNVVALSFDQLD